jgi:type I restriction enzyme M protein
MDPVQNTQATSLSAFVWEAANELWGDFKHTDFARIIIPLLLLRRMECVLEPTKEDVLKAYESEKGSGIDLNIYLPNPNFS